MSNMTALESEIHMFKYSRLLYCLWHLKKLYWELPWHLPVAFQTTFDSLNNSNTA